MFSEIAWWLEPLINGMIITDKWLLTV